MQFLTSYPNLRRRALSCLMVGLSACVVSWPGNSRAQALSLAESEARLAQYHPLIQACQKDPAIAQALQAQASHWNAPRLNLVGEDLLGSAATSGQNYTQWTLELQQDIPLNDYRSRLKQLGTQEALAAQAQCQVVTQTLRQQLQSAYLEALYWQEAVHLQQEQVVLVEQLREGIARQIAQGKRPGLDLLRFDSEQDLARLALQQAQKEAQQRREQLALFWTGSPEFTPPLAEERLQWPGQRPALEHSLSARAAQAQYTVAQKALETAQYQGLPDLTLGSGLRWHPESQDVGINVQVGWSLPNLQAQADRLTVHELEQAKASDALRFAQQTAQQSQRQLQQQLQQKQAQWQLYQTQLIPRAQHYLEKMQKGLLLGKFTLLEVLAARQQAYTLKEEALRLQIALNGLQQALRELGPIPADTAPWKETS